MSRTYKKKYTGAKAFDKTCRNNGSCPYCKSNRTYKNNKKSTLDEELKEYYKEKDE